MKREERQNGEESRRPTIYRTAEKEDHEEGRKREGPFRSERHACPFFFLVRGGDLRETAAPFSFARMQPSFQNRRPFFCPPFLGNATKEGEGQKTVYVPT